MPSASRRRDNEPFEVLMRRFKRAVEKDGILQTYRDREFYEKPSLTKRRARIAVAKRQQRENAELKASMTKKGRR